MNAMDAFRSEPRRAPSPAQEQATERATARAAQRTAARSIERASDRHALRDIERDQAESPEAQRRAVGSEFSALLALLAGTEAPVRPDPAKHGLETIGIPIEPLRARDEDASNEDAVNAQASALELAARSRWGSEPGAGSQISESALDRHIGQPTDSATVVSVPPGQRQTPGNEAAIQRTQTREAILRASSRGAASVEQLRALGDSKGADARAALDALLAQAGTPSGARLAARAIMTNTNASLLNGVSEGSWLDARDARRSEPSELAALMAMANSTASASSAGHANGADVTTPATALAGLDPELRTRVGRVIERMKSEYGHDVTIVETVRSQARQDWLYEQGRSRAGAVVTWTRDSAHTTGEAVDVIIDGSYQNASGFARLQRIAREEGLRTLGMKDPGHLELLHRGSTASGAAASANTNRTTSSTLEPAGAAGVARVAGVAGVATVARITDVQTSPSTGNGGLQAITASASGRSSHNASNQQDGAQGDRSDSSSRSGHRSVETPPRVTDNIPAFGSAGGGATAHAVTSGTERASTGPVTGSGEHVQRVADIQQLRADAPAGPLARMTLNIDNANGTQEQITVNLRGNTVSTHIATDAVTADRLRLRTADLQDALGRHGLEGDAVRISGTRTEATDPARMTGLDRDALKVLAGTAASGDSASQGSAGGQRDRSASERQRDWQHESTRRDQATDARGERQEQQGRQRRQYPFPGNE